MPEPPRRSLLVLLVGIIAISWAAIFVRLCDAPALVIAAYRLGIAALVLSPVYVWSWRRSAVGESWKPNRWIALSGFLLGLHFVAWIAAVQQIPIAFAVTLSSTHPVFVGFLSWLILKEPPGSMTISGGLLVLIGTIGLAWPDGHAPISAATGYLWALGAAICFAGYVLGGRYARRRMNLLAYVWPTYTVAFLAVLLLVWAARLPLVGYSTGTYVMFLLLGFIPTVIGHSSLNWALRYLSANFVAISVLGEPVGATLLALFVLQETPSPLKILFGLVILIGIYLAARDEILG